MLVALCFRRLNPGQTNKQTNKHTGHFFLFVFRYQTLWNGVVQKIVLHHSLPRSSLIWLIWLIWPARIMSKLTLVWTSLNLIELDKFWLLPDAASWLERQQQWDRRAWTEVWIWLKLLLSSVFSETFWSSNRQPVCCCRSWPLMASARVRYGL